MARHRIQRIDEQPLHRVEPDSRWKNLRSGDRVSVRTRPGYETGGLIDAVTDDHTVVWVDLDGGRGRTLLHVSDGVEILPPPS
jgi:hypothetical protein